MMKAEDKYKIALKQFAPVGQKITINTLSWREQAMCEVLDGIIAKQNKLAAQSTLHDAE